MDSKSNDHLCIADFRLDFKTKSYRVQTNTLIDQIYQVDMGHNTDLTASQVAKSFLSGGMAGIVSKTIAAPIERVKYLYLTRDIVFTYKAFFQDFKEIVRNHGVLNLWRGNLMNVAKVFPYAAIDFACFDYLRRRFYKKDQGVKANVILFLCGAFSGASAMTATLSLEFLRIRMAMEKDRFSYNNGYRKALTKIYAFEGPKGFYRGYFASLIGIIIYHGNAFFIFTKLKEFVKTNIPSEHKKWYTDFILGSISSMSLIAAYPFDMVKKRMQGQSLLIERGELDRFLGYRQLIQRMWDKEGVKSFFKGITLNFIKTPFAMAISWTIKNKINRILDSHYDF